MTGADNGFNGSRIENRGYLAEARRVLKKYWGYEDFRWAQRRVILSCLTGRDCLALLPTGGGKSLCYQVPALLLPGVTVVVSPLISLMEDQVGALKQRGISAELLSSSLSATDLKRAREKVRNGNAKLVYIAPERLHEMRSLLENQRISLLAIDESHCISEWGHDFRPHYRMIGKWRRILRDPPCVALTATATPLTREDICKIARLNRPVRVEATFDRPNLWFGVTQFEDERSRILELYRRARKVDGCVIAYVPTRKKTDGVASLLRSWGVAALPYHAGLPSDARSHLLNEFLDGRIKVMVATNAFGMGIDQPHVRLVIHLGIPPRPEAYYQEAGRAGRDGNLARCEIFWIKQDFVLTRGLANVADTANPTVRKIRKAGLDTMLGYVRNRRCRRRTLLNYLGEDLGSCSGCDRC